MTIQNHKNDGVIPSAGDVLAWMGTHVIVRRIGRTKTWADVKIRQLNGAVWSKRLALPLPADVRPCAHPDDEMCDCARIPDSGFPEEP
jgi:hypothetical protein